MVCQSVALTLSKVQPPARRKTLRRTLTAVARRDSQALGPTSLHVIRTWAACRSGANVPNSPDARRCPLREQNRLLGPDAAMDDAGRQ